MLLLINIHFKTHFPENVNLKLSSTCQLKNLNEYTWLDVYNLECLFTNIITHI